ncbi:MAG TPA: polysaccharide deacetylase family protein [Candidatus Limnocylindrales bacterium]|nr:polysaccharide deacetylase family protein [Candidatus Limnocylindrales bacterium]
MIHLDLDGGTQIYRIHGWSYEAQDDPLFETGLQQALDFFDKVKVRATLFVIAEDLNHPGKCGLIKEAVKRGHEIASHSFTHRKLTTLVFEEKRREIFESRERIMTGLGVEVFGFRAPDFDIDREVLELVDRAGYLYDSSLFSDVRFARKVGVTGLSRLPHRPLENRSLVELPLPGYAPLPLPFHPCYSLVLGTWYFRLGLRKFRRTGTPLVLLFHLTDFADPLPTHRLTGWKSRLFTLSHMKGEPKRHRCEEMLEIVRREYTFVDTRALVQNVTTAPPGAQASCLQNG